MSKSWIKQFLPSSLLGRSLLIIIVPLVLLQAVTAYIFFDRHWETISLRLSNAVAGEISMVVQALEQTQDPIARWQTLSRTYTTLDLAVSFEEGGILPPAAQDEGGHLETMLSRALDERVRKPYRVDPQAGDNRVEILVQIPGGILRVLVHKKRLFSSTTYIFILWMVGTSLVLFAVATIFMRNQVRPIRRLARAADLFGKGREAPSFKAEGAREVRQAATAFIRMRERIKRQIAQRTEMLAGVSHDLGTVLTRIKLELALLKDGDTIEALNSDVVEMEKMIEGYLSFARGEGAEDIVPCNVEQIIEEAATPVRRGGTRITSVCDSGLTLPLRPHGFKRCLANLLNNAARHGDAIWAEAHRQEDGVTITIDDNGPGIPADAFEDVFRPFFRMDSARNLDKGGVGLGLSISRDIIHGHGGEISLDQSPQGGLRVRISLPA